MLEHRRDFLVAGFVYVVGEITVQHGLFREAVKVIHEKDTKKILSVVNCLEMVINCVREVITGAEIE
jgi:hypothetical protein